MRRPDPSRRGFTLLSVLLVLVLVLTVLVTTLRESSDALSSAAFHRDRELMSAAVDVAVAAGMDRLSTIDETGLLALGVPEDVAPPYDIFNFWSSAQPFVNDMTYPPTASAGELKDVMTIRVGAIRGQRLRPPPGEDVRAAYGAVVHLLVSVRSNRPGAPALEQRYEVGVRVPESGSYQ